MSEKKYITTEGYKKLKQELNQLREVSRAKIATKIKEARDMGDVLENLVYDAALDEQGYIEGRISEIEEALLSSEIITKNDTSKEIVEIGATVIVQIETNIDTFTIVGSAEADPIKRLISNESPVGKALIGAKINDIVEVKTPIFTAVYKIVEIKWKKRVIT